MQDILPPNRRSRIRPELIGRPQPILRMPDRNTAVYIERSDVVRISTSGIVTVTEDEIIRRESVYSSKVNGPAIRMVQELSSDEKIRAMTKALVVARMDLDNERRKKSFLKRLSLTLVAVILILSTGYVGIDTWLTNNRAKAEIDITSDYQDSSLSSSITSSSAEGTDKTPLPANTLAKYNVAPDLPRALYIDKIDVSARVLPMGVNNDGNIQAPRNIFDVGWYMGSVKPGEIGAMFVDGHSSGLSSEGLFGNLDKLVEGDTLQIEKGDGTRITYKVVHTETVDLEAVDMKKMLLPYGSSLRGLNLMTCSGKWIDSSETLSQRVLVFTEQIY